MYTPELGTDSERLHLSEWTKENINILNKTMDIKHRIIGIAGKKQSGKDTVCNIIKELVGWEKCFRVAFADPLKDEIARAIGMDREYINSNKDNFRLILQGWGTDFRRKLCGEDYWIKKWESKVSYMQQEMPQCIIVAPDVRFQNEVNVIHKMGGKVYVVIPSDFKPVEDLHVSECSPLNLFDGQVTNVYNKKELLVSQIKAILL